MAALYGQLRALLLTPLQCLVAVYVVVSLPYYITHIALAGYADIWLTAGFTLSALSLCRWIRDKDHRHAVVVLLLILALPFVKQYGIAFSGMVLAAAIAGWLPPRILLLVSGLTITAFAYLIATIGLSVDLPFLGQLTIGPEKVSLPPYNHQFVADPPWHSLAYYLLYEGTWHHLWYFVPILFPVAIVLSWQRADQRAIITQVSLAVAVVLSVHLFTEQSEHLLDGTTINRHLLVVVPGLIAWFVLVYNLYFGTASPSSVKPNGYRSNL